MKRLLVLALLSIPALASAQEPPVSETWTTYCDGGVEKVRATLVFHIGGTILGYDGGEVSLCVTNEVDGCWPDNWNGTMTPIGNGDYQVTWQGWNRACVSASVTRSGVVVFLLPDPEGTFSYWVPLHCDDGTFTIIDNVECVPLPVAQSTWGAVKALYRAQGDKP